MDSLWGLTALHKFASDRMTYPTDVPLHHCNPRDWVLSKSWKNKYSGDQFDPKYRLDPIRFYEQLIPLLNQKESGPGSTTPKLNRLQIHTFHPCDE